MLQLKKEELFKSRSHKATIAAAYTTFTSNYKQIFKHTWPFALALALVAPAYMLYGIMHQKDMVSTGYIATNIALLVVFFVVSLAFYARLSMLVNQQNMKWNATRWVKTFLWQLLIFIGIVAITGAISALVAMGIMPDDNAATVNTDPVAAQVAANEAMLKMIVFAVIITLLLSLLTMPYLPVLMKYVADPTSKIRKLFFKQYGVYMHYWGYIFITLLITTICVGLVTFVIALPMIIIMLASHISHMGVVNGDAAGVPAYFPWMAYGVGVLTYFIYIFINVFTFFVIYYIYGSIEAKEKDKKNSITN